MIHVKQCLTIDALGPLAIHASPYGVAALSGPLRPFALLKLRVGDCPLMHLAARRARRRRYRLRDTLEAGFVRIDADRHVDSRLGARNHDRAHGVLPNSS